MDSSAREANETAATAPARVLVVDDDLAALDLFAASLQDAGFVTATATSAAEALAVLDRSMAAVVLDNRLPDATGTDFVRRLRRDPRYTTLPVLLVTADDGLQHRVAGLDAGATDYLVKPVDPAELVARVAAQLRAQRAWYAVVDTHLRERAELVSSLFAIAPRATAEDTADAICEHVLGAGRVDGVAVASLDREGRVGLLAARGSAPFAAALRRLTNAPPAYFAPRASHPWIEHGDGLQSGPACLAVAPLRLGGATVGLFALAPARHTIPSIETDQALAEAIDYAGAATGLLGISLHARSEQVRRRDELVGILRERAFRPVFQPMVDLRDGRVVGYEALTRFDGGSRPDTTFSEAARVGLGVELELATMSSAVEAAARLPDAQFVSLNVTPDLVVNHRAQMCEVLRRVDRPVVLELTEHDPVDDYATLRDALDHVDPPVRLSIDDAGAGFASLRHVIMLRPDFVKLDRSWVAGVDTDPARQAMVGGLAHFARATGCVLVAEGIEAPAERETLRALDVALGQGFLLGEPALVAA